MNITTSETTKSQQSINYLNTPWHTQHLYESVIQDYLPKQKRCSKTKLRYERNRRLTKLAHKKVRGEIRQRAHVLATQRERIRAQQRLSSTATQRNTLHNTAWLPISMSYDCSMSTE